MSQTAIAVPRVDTQPSGKKRKAYVETYGCQMNVSDGELMQGILAAGGYDFAASAEEADVILVNTCAIRDHAEQRVLGRVGELYRLKRERPDVVIGVTGCMAQRMGTDLLERAPYVDLVMGPDNYRRLPEAIARIESAASAAPPPVAEPKRRRALPVVTLAALGAEAAPAPALPNATLPGRGAGAEAAEVTEIAEIADAVAADESVRGPVRVAALAFEAAENYEDLEIRRSSGVAAWVPVQRGCNYRCTYCIVPYVRGSEKNRDPERILDEVRGIAVCGTAEVVLLGQTVNSYEHGDWDFPRLLRAVARVDGIRRVRFTSPHPNDFTRELVAVMAEEPAVCRQLHLPVQSGDDRTLKRMLRRYTVAEYLEKIAWVRAAIPNIALSTDIIVAFPGETEEEYQATLELMRRVRFDDAYMYKYSPREGTPATRLPSDQFVAEDVAQHRLERLIELHRSIQAEINAREVGSVVEVLVEKSARSAGDVLGRTETNKVVAFAGTPELVGRFVSVRLTSTTGATFHGEMVAGRSARVA